VSKSQEQRSEASADSALGTEERSILGQARGNQAALAGLGAGAGGAMAYGNAAMRDAVGNANQGARDKVGSVNTGARDKASSAKDKARDQHEKRDQDEGNGGGGSQHATWMDHDDKRPDIHHDHGFLDDGSGNIDESKREDPTWRDRLEKLKWVAKLEAAELLRPDLVDACATYRHFLFGGGAERPFSYERFVEDDSSGATVLASAIEDAQHAATEKHDQLIAGKPPQVGKTTFRMRTPGMGVGNDGRYPYPSTENWQKAIGAHSIWFEIDVTVEVYEKSRTDPPGVDPDGPPMCTPAGDSVVTYGRRFEVDLTLHAEDRYNFNPGAADIATGTPDEANGRFEITGLGQEFMSTATLERELAFEATMDPVAVQSGNAATASGEGRSGRPRDARARPTAR